VRRLRHSLPPELLQPFPSGHLLSLRSPLLLQPTLLNEHPHLRYYPPPASITFDLTLPLALSAHSHPPNLTKSLGSMSELIPTVATVAMSRSQGSISDPETDEIEDDDVPLMLDQLRPALSTAIFPIPTRVCLSC
jgi:hypothetical protein